MKKFIDLTTIAIVAVAVAGFLFRQDVGRELEDLLKMVMHKFAPWINSTIYS